MESGDRPAPTGDGEPSAAATRPASRRDLDRLIALIPSLAALEDADRFELVRLARTVRVPAGTTVVRRGEAGDAAYFVLSGRLLAGVPASGGRYASLSTMGVGDFFGEITALAGGTRTADVVADEASELLVVPAPVLHRLALIPQLREVLLPRLTERLARTLILEAAGDEEAGEAAGAARGEGRADAAEPPARGPSSESLPRTYDP